MLHSIDHIDSYDTGEWHLTIFFSRRRAHAFLNHLLDPTVKKRILLDERWKTSEKNLFQKIETVVYEHPTLLDDYSADIIISTPDTLWFPAEMMSDESAMEDAYRMIFPQADPADLFIEKDEDLCAITSGAAGLKSFMGRTFPGARISSREMILMRKFRSYPGGGCRLYVHLEDEEVILTSFDGHNLLCAATHEAHTATEAMYVVMMLLQAYSLDPKSTEIFISGDRHLRAELLPMLRKHIRCVMHTMLPSDLEANGIPLASALTARKDKTLPSLKKDGIV